MPGLVGRSGELRQNGLLVAASCAGMAISVIHLYAVGLFIIPLEKAFGWTRSEITLGLTIVSITAFLFLPLVGMLIDRIGPRRIAIFGVTGYLGTIALLSTVGSSLWNWWGLWTLLAVFAVTIKAPTWATAITGAFQQERGMALSIMLCGAGICSSGLPYLTHMLLTHVGWRASFIGIALIAVLIALPLILFGFRTRPRAVDAASVAASASSPGRRQTIRSPVFLKLGGIAFLASFALSAMSVHYVPLLVARSMDAGTAAQIAGLVGISSIVGRLVTGYALDRLPSRYVGMATFLLPAVAAVLLASSGASVPVATFAACTLGFGLGAEVDVIAYMSARAFGTRNFGSLFGMISSLLGLGVGAGPLMASIFYDLTGSYDGVLLVLAGIFAVCVVVISTIRIPSAAA